MTTASSSSSNVQARAARRWFVRAVLIAGVWCLLSVIAVPGASGMSQDVALDWAVAAGGPGGDVGKDIAVDAAGNVYTTGYFENTVDFDPGPGTTNLISNGDRDIFLAVYSPTGSLLSAISIGGPGNDRGSGLALDAAGNARITGFFEDTVDFDPGAGATNLTSNGEEDAFLAVYDLNGGLVSAIAMGGPEYDDGSHVAVDGAGNSVVVGTLSATVDFDPGPSTTNLISNGAHDAYVATYGVNGDLVSAFAMGGLESDFGLDLALDGAGAIYVTGSFQASADFAPNAGVSLLTSAGRGDAYVAKYNSAGNLLFAFALGGTGSEIGLGIDVDSDGNIHISGTLGETVDFDPGPGVTSITAVGDNQSAFLAVFDSAGGLISAIGIGGNGFDLGLGVAVDGEGNSYVTGSFKGTADFDPGSGVTNLSADGDNQAAFLAIYSPSGSLISALAIGGTGFDAAERTAIGADGSIHIVGSFLEGVDFDPGPGVTPPSGGTNGVFVARYQILDEAPQRTCLDLTPTIDMNTNGGNGTGTPGPDVILGTPGPDVIDGLGGDDTICGEGGDDIINGGDGNDLVRAGSGDDTVNGGNGNDRLFGVAGNDTMNGDAGTDTLHGNRGADTLDGGPDDDRVFGYADDDTLSGGTGNDKIFGHFGNDIINGNDGDDRLFGWGDNDTINGNEGNDLISGNFGDDTISGGAGNDTLYGADGDDVVHGGSGDDQVNGNSLNDTLTGGPGDDTLDGGINNDSCDGGANTDTATRCETVVGIP